MQKFLWTNRRYGIKARSGIGKALFLSCMHSMAANGYAYAIIGGVGPADFCAKAVGATIIEHSSPGIYRDQLTKEKTKD